MFAAERRKKIKEIMLEYKHMDINTLCSLLSVSVATIRRDLDQLEIEGVLKKSHGGAMLVENETSEIVLNVESDPYYREKSMIGKIAADFVEPGNAIFIGSGSTCVFFARHLVNVSDIIVVTNNVHAAMEIVGRPGISTVLLGGDVELADGRMSTFGMYAQENMNNMYISKAFISPQGASLQSGYTVSSREQAMIYKQAMDQADETVLLLDYSKFGKRAFVPFAPLNRFKKVISNIQVPQEFKEYYFENNITLYTSFE